MIRSVSLTLACLLISTASMAQLPDIDAVLNEMVEVYGGEQNLGKMDRMVQEWALVARMGNRHGTDLRSVNLPMQLKVELTYPDKTETRILNGASGFTIFGDRPAQAAAIPQRDAMMLQLMRMYSPLALRNFKNVIKLSDNGSEYVLTLSAHGVVSEYFVNKESRRIERVAGTLKINGNLMSFVTEYSDFKMVDGVLVHQREDKYAGTVNTAQLQLRRIEFDASFGQGYFDPPEKAQDSLITAGAIRMIAPPVMSGLGLARTAEDLESGHGAAW